MLLLIMDMMRNIKSGKTLFQNPYLEIVHIAFPNIIFYKLSGYLEKPDASEFFEKIINTIDETGARYIISDLSDFKGSNLNLAKFANEVWIPVIAGKGVTHVAMNHPKSDFGAFTSKIAAGKKAHELIHFRKFRELEEAFIWIQEIDDRV